MSDLNKEALEVWGALKPMIDQEISSRTQGMVQRRKAKVTTAPSLATNTIGVTEAFGDEMFLPFVSNMISAKVGDFVWIEWMYGATNAFVSSFAAVDDKDFTVAGVLDVVTRRCYNTSISTSGWYRICICNNATAYSGAEGSFVNFYITRAAGFTYNEVHKISLATNYNRFEFLGEESFSSVLGIDKIRATFNSTSRNLYVDIHYNLSKGNAVTARIDPYRTIYKDTVSVGEKYWVAESMQSVADSPSGETVVKEYSFSGNTEGVGAITAGAYTELFYDGTHLYRQGKIVTGFIKAKMNATVPASAWRSIANIPSGFRPYSSVDFLAINNAASNSGELHIRARIEQSTGNVVIWPYTAIASGTGIYLSFTYYTG